MTAEITLSRTLLPPGSRVLCAVSGGADSVCLLHLVRALGDVECLCAHFDHGLRGEASAADAAFVEGLCRDWQIPFFTEKGDVAAFARSSGQSLETAGRQLRYDFLRRTAERCGADRIATAHTMNDNAETILFRMARGTGLRGLGGIPAERDGIVRPLLAVSRAEIETYLRERDIPWVEDATNAGDAAARNRVRHHVLPALEDVHPGAAANIARMGELLREDEEFLTALAREKLDAWGEERLPAAELAALPRSLSGRVLRLWLGAELSREQCEAVLSLCGKGPSARAELPGGRTVRREYGWLLCAPTGETALPERELRPGETLALPEAGLTAVCDMVPDGGEIQKTFNTFVFSSAKICDTLTVASRRPGESILLEGRAGTRRIKELLIDAKIPRDRRDRLPVVRCGDRVVAVYGFGQAEGLRPGPGERGVRIEFRENTEEERE